MFLRQVRERDCEELDKKRILLEEMLSVKEISYEKRIRFCKAFASD
jgi:hypothetical protein